MADTVLYDLLPYESKLITYIKLNKPVFNMDAVFSDETRNFVSDNEPEKGSAITIRIRTAAGDCDKVFAVINGNRHECRLLESDSVFDYYGISIVINERISYYFLIVREGRIYFYNKKGIDISPNADYNFIIIPGFKTPLWAKGAVMYQIFVDRFYNGNKDNDVVDNEYAYLGKAAKFLPQWGSGVENEDICNFYGGDIDGIIEKMGYLKDLGVEVLYLSPIFVSPSSHKYDIQDYDYVDPHFGRIVNDGGEALTPLKFNNKFASKYVKRTTDKANLEASNQLVAEMIKIAHENGMKVIFDGVFNHCGAFNKWLDKEGFYSGEEGYSEGAYKSENSPYNSYFKWYERIWPNNDCYDAWWGHDNHPKLNFEGSKELYDYILEIGKKWVSPPYNADGWRLDVAADLGYSKEFNHRFWRDFRKAVKEANPEAIILAEHYGDPSDWLKGDQWDTIMNYDAFMEPITWFLTGMEKHSEDFRYDMLNNGAAFEGAMRYHMSHFSIQSLQASMNELSNHDHSRFLTRTNRSSGRLHTRGGAAADADVNRGVFMEAVVFQMTWPGAPTVYYGDEAGLKGWTDPDNRRTYPWGEEDAMFLDFHKEAIKMHKNHTALRTGSLEFLNVDYGVISFGRWDDRDKIAVALNNTDDIKHVIIPVWRIGIHSGEMEVLLSTDGFSFRTEKVKYKVNHGFVTVFLPKYSSIVLREIN